MAQVFPQMGKCNFRMYGPSGSIETRDVMCLLPTNVANEKIYITLWLWLVILFCITALWLIYRLFSMIRFTREPIFKFRVVTLPRFWKKSLDDVDSRLATTSDVDEVLYRFHKYSDFILLSQLGDNMEAGLFSEFIHHLANHRPDEIKNSSSSNDSGVHETDPYNAKKREAYGDDEEEDNLMPRNGTYPNLEENLPSV